MDFKIAPKSTYFLIPLSHEHVEMPLCILLTGQGLFATDQEINRLYGFLASQNPQSNRKGKCGPIKNEVIGIFGMHRDRREKALRELEEN